jgi:hypothetical protein
VIRAKTELAQEAVSDTVRTTARLTPMRAVILSASSRLSLAALVMAVAIVVVALGRGDVVAQSTPPTSVGLMEIGDGTVEGAVGQQPSGSRLSVALMGLVTALEPPDERLVSFATGARQNRMLEVRMAVTVRDGGAVEIERLVAVLEQVGLQGVRVRSVVPVPTGSRLDLTGRILVTSDRMPSADQIPEDRVVSGLAGLVASTGAALSRLDMPAAHDGAVRLTARGSADEVVHILSELESHFSSPLRIDELRVESGADGTYELSSAFRLRGPFVGSEVQQ